MYCSHCDIVAPDNVKFCETCGTRLLADSVDASASGSDTCACGAGPDKRDAQGYCAVCGLRAKPRGRDHLELSISPSFAAVTDKGKRHPRNEDDFAIAERDIEGKTTRIIVVCDGVSTSQYADEASALAAKAAVESLTQAARNGLEPKRALTTAIKAAHDAVCTLPYHANGVKDPAGTTIVCAFVQGETATIAWVGDSRAYWVTPNEAVLLTHDHSWVNDVVDSGEMTEVEALTSKSAHAITQCLGPLNDDERKNAAPEPSLVSFALLDACRLIVCTDGFWNYASPAETVAALVRETPDADALSLSRRLVGFANSQGGRDNIAVAILMTPA